jgi:hypothetical protein
MQTGTIISCSSINANQFLQFWNVEYSYQLDAGGIGTALIAVGAGLAAAVSLWASPNGTITVSPNPTGTTNPVSIPCPDIVKWAAFGIPVKGLPVAESRKFIW